ncbi:MAG: hypothetical protein HW391_512 [Chloroflexi bacterium]|nr:hypothetical protein [Chloroflexota bacterium]
MQDMQTKPNGPVAAAFVAAGIGSLVLGIFVVLNEVSTDINTFLKFDASYGLGSGVGPLSGKVALATIAYLASWVVLHFYARGKEVNFSRWFMVALVLVFAGFALTFPPIFEFVVGLFPAAE